MRFEVSRSTWKVHKCWFYHICEFFSLQKQGYKKGTNKNDSPANLLFTSVCEYTQYSSPVSRSTLGSLESLSIQGFWAFFFAKWTIFGWHPGVPWGVEHIASSLAIVWKFFNSPFIGSVQKIILNFLFRFQINYYHRNLQGML